MNDEIRHHMHALINQLPSVQLSAIETLLQSMIDPLSSRLALAPMDDEAFTEEDRQAVGEADEWRKSHTAPPLEDVLSDFGSTLADWEFMGKTPQQQNG